jgi:hypothetical protein
VEIIRPENEKKQSGFNVKYTRWRMDHKNTLYSLLKSEPRKKILRGAHIAFVSFMCISEQTTTFAL